MRNITVSGFIVADAEKRVRANGIGYWLLRMGNNEFGDGKDEQGRPINSWYSCFLDDRIFGNLGQHLKKGKPIIVSGRYSDKIYSRNDGQCDISREINVTDISFMPYEGNNKNNAGTQQTMPDSATSHTGSATPPQPQQTYNSKPTTADLVIPAQDDTDDLPF